MNLHLVPDNTFINAFYDNLREASLLENNRIVVRTNTKALKSVKRDIAFAPLYSSKFNSIVGDTFAYDKVYIHYFTPLLYKWIARNRFREVNWLTWGGDIYNLPYVDHLCYEPITRARYAGRHQSLKQVLYELKILILHSAFKKKAYSKVANILTWMEQEHEFALRHLPVNARHKFFFYENQLPYSQLDSIEKKVAVRDKPLLMIGNSGSPTNNHLDAIDFLEKHQVHADLLIPVSYGNPNYISFLKKNLVYKHGKVEFVDRYMQFNEYIQILANADALVMNTIRPQGYGNIFIMLYLGKPVYFNKNNISLPDLTRYGIRWQSMEDITNAGKNLSSGSNREAIIALLSHERLIGTYKTLFN